jgi:hypothetical protein
MTAKLLQVVLFLALPIGILRGMFGRRRGG